ncbi:MAG: GspH/FimT family pseudopilin [Desulfobacteraceae bacterium]|jgi:prepilin-type N-terminal cleavage/methylation domain-containing protein
MLRKEGFTLIELLVTIIILVILASIAIPAFSRWYPNYKLRSAATDLYSNLQWAKLEAVKENADCAVVFNAGAGTYQVISGGADKDYYATGDNVVRRTMDFLSYDKNGNIGYGRATGSNPLDAGRGFDNNITLDDNNGGNDGDDTVVFNSRGMINRQFNSAGEVYLRNNKNTSYVVAVMATGSILLRRWDPSSASWE